MMIEREEIKNLLDKIMNNSLDLAACLKKNPIYIETKSKRLQLLMQPSLHLKLKTIASKQAISVNDLIHSILDEYFTKK